eukprot:1498580-Amphidinium_carterae.1
MAGCLNTRAVLRLAKLVSEYASISRAPAARQPDALLAILTWPPTNHLCWPFAPNAYGQVHTAPCVSTPQHMPVTTLA